MPAVRELAVDAHRRLAVGEQPAGHRDDPAVLGELPERLEIWRDERRHGSHCAGSAVRGAATLVPALARQVEGVHPAAASAQGARCVAPCVLSSGQSPHQSPNFSTGRRSRWAGYRRPAWSTGSPGIGAINRPAMAPANWTAIRSAPAACTSCTTVSYRGCAGLAGLDLCHSLRGDPGCLRELPLAEVPCAADPSHEGAHRREIRHPVRFLAQPGPIPHLENSCGRAEPAGRLGMASPDPSSWPRGALLTNR